MIPTTTSSKPAFGGFSNLASPSSGTATTTPSFGIGAAPDLARFTFNGGGLGLTFNKNVAPSLASSINFGAPKTTAASTSGFGMGGFTPTTLSTPSFGLSSPSTGATGFAPKPAGATGFSLGTPGQNTLGGATSGFGLNTGAGILGQGTPPATGTPGLSLSNVSTAASSGFNLGTPTTTTVGFSMSGGAATTGFSLAQVTAPASTGFSLGASTTSAPAKLSFGTTTTTSTGFSLPTPATAATGFALGGSSTTAPTLGLSTASTASTGFSLASTSTTTADTTAKTTTTTAFSLGATLGTVTPATATTTPTTQPKGSVTFAQLEETINKWTLELEEQERVFLNQMEQVRDWDRLLLSTGDKIVGLNDGMEKVKLRQHQLDHELDFIVAQQRELEECLAPLEKEFADITISDPERNSVYQRAENLNTQLQQISEQLKSVIEHVNERNRSQDITDPIVQIGRILNAHMNSLQWVDQSVSVIQQMLDQINNMREIHRRDIDSTQNL